MSPQIRSTVWTTPRILKTSLYVLVALQVVVLLGVLTAARIHRLALKTIGKDSAPSIVAAQHIKSALADMDANAANELLEAPGKGVQAVQTYEARRVEAAKSLIAAAENITFGEAERAPLERLQVGLGKYETMIQRARDLHERNDPLFIPAYANAARVLDTELLPSADALDKANLDMLEAAYAGQGRTTSLSRAFVIVSASVLIVCLMWSLSFLSRRTNRIFNPGLLLATLLTGAVLVYCWRATGTGHRQLKVAKEDAFTSIHALWRARAVAYSANGDESRYLLDTGNAARHESVFFKKVAEIATVPEGNRIEQFAVKLPSSGKAPGFTGFLANELGNITFAGEEEQARQALLWFGTYVRVDSNIRQLERTKKHAEAIALCTGVKQGDSNWAFDKFDKALGSTLDINQRAFDGAVSSGFAALDGLEWKASVMMVLAGLLTFWGLFRRIQEYQ